MVFCYSTLICHVNDMYLVPLETIMKRWLWTCLRAPEPSPAMRARGAVSGSMVSRETMLLIVLARLWSVFWVFVNVKNVAHVTFLFQTRTICYVTCWKHISVWNIDGIRPWFYWSVKRECKLLRELLWGFTFFAFFHPMAYLFKWKNDEQLGCHSINPYVNCSNYIWIILLLIVDFNILSELWFGFHMHFFILASRFGKFYVDNSLGGGETLETPELQ